MGMITAATITEIGFDNAPKHAMGNMYFLGNVEIKEREWLLNLLAQNNERDSLFKDSVLLELRHFSDFFSTVLFSFGSALVLRKIIRKNKRLKLILQFKELQQVRNNIEKGSFAYDTLLFNQSAFQILKNRSHLANLVCLAILFGDEFIDGIAQVYGKERIQQILYNKNINFSLQQKIDSDSIELYYQFDIRSFLPETVLKSTNEKYAISYYEFYEHLLFLLSELNRHLNALGRVKSLHAANLICTVCNKCFDTYQTDIVSFNPNYSLQELIEYQEKKDDDIIQGLLALRSVLLQKKTRFYQSKFASWSIMVRTMQVYDDMQDVASDANYQMNFLCYFSKNYYSTEWIWLQNNLALIHALEGQIKHLLISVYMPASVMMCMQYAKNLSQNYLSWDQKKITGYLWKKNWFLCQKEPYANSNEIDQHIYGKVKCSVKDKLWVLQQKVLSIKDPILNEDVLYAHIADIAIMDSLLRQSFYRSLSKKDAYFLKHSFFDFPIFKKAALVKRWILKEGETN